MTYMVGHGMAWHAQAQQNETECLENISSFELTPPFTLVPFAAGGTNIGSDALDADLDMAAAAGAVAGAAAGSDFTGTCTPLIGAAAVLATAVVAGGAESAMAFVFIEVWWIGCYFEVISGCVCPG